jgi:type III pantothenate kinase
MIGARARFASVPLLVINAGTATTVDAVDGDGRFLGGVIAPGVEMMRAALARGTARLPLAAGDYVELPDNTDDAIRTGILDAQIGLIVQRMQRLRQQAGSAVQTVVSGGNGPTLHALLRAQGGLGTMALEPDLVLLGLWYRARAQSDPAPTSRNP